MASYSFRLPDVGEGVAEAEIVAWHAKIGDRIAEDDPLCDIMTDKATVEMTSPIAGILREIGGGVGDQIAIGSTLAVFETVESGELSEPATADPPLSAPQDPIVHAETDLSSTPNFVATSSVHASEAIPAAKVGVLASPAVRQRAKSMEIDLASVKSGDGRVRHADLDAFLHYNASRGYRTAGGRRMDEEVPVVGLRRRIAENMANSKRHIPHFSYIEEIDVTKLEALRADLNATREDRPKLSVLPLIIIAICRAVPKFPMMNARYDDNAGVVTRYGAVHLGIATQTNAGLMVPVLRDAQDRNIWQLAEEIARLANAARTNKATSGELSGSTLTLTSLGPLGGLATTPVINRPEVAILGPNRIIDRPIFREGNIVAAKLMNFSISCDHRVVDGWDAANFVQTMKALLETPALLFVD